jgi:hypothetical protein
MAQRKGEPSLLDTEEEEEEPEEQPAEVKVKE